MTRRPQRPVLTPVTPITPTLSELDDARRLAARYQSTRAIPLNTPVLGPLNLGVIARDAFPVNAWKRAAARKRQRSAQTARRAAVSIGIMAFALRAPQLTYAISLSIGPRYTRPTTPAA